MTDQTYHDAFPHLTGPDWEEAMDRLGHDVTAHLRESGACAACNRHDLDGMEAGTVAYRRAIAGPRIDAHVDPACIGANWFGVIVTADWPGTDDDGWTMRLWRRDSPGAAQAEYPWRTEFLEAGEWIDGEEEFTVPGVAAPFHAACADLTSDCIQFDDEAAQIEAHPTGRLDVARDLRRAALDARLVAASIQRAAADADAAWRYA